MNATVKLVQAKIEAMCEKTLARCYLTWKQEWDQRVYWLVFPDDDIRSRLRFERIQEVMDWLEAFEKRHPSTDAATAQR